MYLIIFILGSFAGTIGTLLFTAKAITKAENQTLNRCLKDAQRSFGYEREAWK